MVESYLFSSALTLFIMGCLALALSILFRFRFKALNCLPQNLSASLFHRTFIVFNPYTQQKKVIHSFLSLLPTAVGFATLGLALGLLLAFEAGLLLSSFITIIGLNLIVLEEAPETYRISKTFIVAVQKGADLGTGDLNIFQKVKTFMPKLSNYYLGLSVVLIAFSAALPYIWSSALWVFTQYTQLIFQISANAAAAGWIVCIFLLALALVVIQIFASMIKRKLMGYKVSTSSGMEDL